MHEALYYDRRDDGSVECRLCPHHCVLADGGRGVCRSRVNHGGVLVAESYGRVCALAIDPVEKKPFHHFMPGTRCLSLATTGCNLRCLNCQNNGISQAMPHEVEHRMMSPQAVVSMAVAHGCPSVAYTYTEPLTYYEYTLDCAKAARRYGLKNMLVTAGYVEPEPLAELLPWIDAANVDVKAMDDGIYRSLCRATLPPVLHTILAMRQAGVWVELTCLLVTGHSDRPALVEKLCQWMMEHDMADTPLHITRFFPRHKLLDLDPTPLSAMRQARDAAMRCGIKHVYLGNV